MHLCAKDATDTNPSESQILIFGVASVNLILGCNALILPLTLCAYHWRWTVFYDIGTVLHSVKNRLKPSSNTSSSVTIFPMSDLDALENEEEI